MNSPFERAAQLRPASAMRVAAVAALTLATLASVADAQEAALPAASPLDAYVAEALRANLGLRQRRLALEQREAGALEARGRYLPTLAVDARYSESSGNVVDIGRLVNPAYRTLNQLTGSSAFPTNVDARLPVTQDTRLRLTQPLFQPAIRHNHQLARAQERMAGTELRGAARQLAASVQAAYLDHARATRVAALYRNTLPLVAENLRVNERLVEAGRATPDVVFRARAEQADVEQQLRAAEAREGATRRAFNLLLDRDLATPLPLTADSLLDPGPLPSAESALRLAERGREELQQLDVGADAARAQSRLARAGFLPAVVAAIDYGVQGTQYSFARDQDYALATLSVSWNLFNGGQDRARVQQASLEQSRLDVQRRAAGRQVALDVETAHENAVVAERAVATAEKRLESAEQSFRLVQRRHAEGLATLVEFIDARTSYTNAGLNRVLTRYDYLVRRVELDRAAALTPLPSLDR